MRFFFPDSQDQVDPDFDFILEQGHEFRVRQRDDRYAHEVLAKQPYDGILVSKPIVDGLSETSGKYTAAQRHRLYRLGVKGFFRLTSIPDAVTMGDCGSFSYVKDFEPPYSVDDLIDFYEGCGFDYGISLDHVVLGFDSTEREPPIEEWRRRRDLSLALAADFLKAVGAAHSRVIPVGAAQGWSPTTYASSVADLQRMGYRYIALGGMVPLKTEQILASLEAIASVRDSYTRLHLLGVSRPDVVDQLADYGVASFDTTSPFRQAFKDDRDNYYTDARNYLAIRVPQVEGNARLKALIRAGRVDQARAAHLERACLEALRAFDAGAARVVNVVETITTYERLLNPDSHHAPAYTELLEAAPWKTCECGICSAIGIEIVVFRGTERNKRRGFHNLYVFRERLRRQAGWFEPNDREHETAQVGGR